LRREGCSGDGGKISLHENRSVGRSSFEMKGEIDGKVGK